MIDKMIIGIVSFATILASIQVDQYIPIVGLLLTVALAPRYFKNRELREENRQLKSAVATIETVVTAKDLRITQLEADLKGAEARANAAEKETIRWKGHHDALKPFTAEPAFRRLEGVLVRMEKRDQATQQLIRRLAGEVSVYQELGEQQETKPVDGEDG